MNDLDPTVRAELDALEDALNGAPGADPVLVALVEDVRATARPMPLALRTRLEEGAAAGFPRRRRLPGLPALRPLTVLPALAAVLVALVVGTAALRGGGDGGGGDTLQSLSAPPAATQDKAVSSAAESAGAGAGTALPPSVTTTSTFAPTAPTPRAAADALGRARKVERAAELGLRVGRGQLEEAADGVVRVTQALGGYVSTSQVSARGSGGTADFTLRVPAAKLDRALQQLGRLGHVTRLDQSAQDITSSFVSVEDRLGDARAERRALLRALGRATTAREIASLKARLAGNRQAIARLKGDLAALRRRADLSTIQVGIVARGRAAVAPGGSGDDRWSPGDAARDALRVLETAAGVLLIALAVLLPLALIGAAGALTGRALRRRRREHALDPR